MKTWQRHLGLYTILAAAVGCLTGPLHTQDAGIHWLGNYREALRQAKETGKPIFLEFRCEA